jgi:FtsZ-interacting cell division protein ZipA
MSLTEILAGLLALVTLVAGALFKSRQHQAQLREDAERKARAAQAETEHQRKLNKAAGHQRRKTDKKVQDVRDAEDGDDALHPFDKPRS